MAVLTLAILCKALRPSIFQYRKGIETSIPFITSLQIYCKYMIMATLTLVNFLDVSKTS